MKIGAQYMGDEQGPKVFARRAEEAGFDSLWCGDHVGHYVEGVSTLGCFAGATERIDIGLNLLVVPYRPPAVVAKALATIAMVAPGRVTAAFGVGGEFPGEFEATGADLRTRGAYTNEALEVLTRLWTGDAVTFEGRWVQMHDFRLEPPPCPPPEIWVGGRSDAALQRAVRFANGYIPYLVSPEQLSRRRQRLGELAAEVDRRLERFTLACLITLIPGPSIDEAVELGLHSLRLSGLTAESVRAQYLLGDDTSVVSRLQDYVDAGLEHVILGCIPGDERLVDNFFEACARILPAARELKPKSNLGVCS